MNKMPIKIKVKDIPNQMSMIQPITTVEEALESFKVYQNLQAKLADKGDFVAIPRKDKKTGKVIVKQHPTKRFANKLTKFFGLSVEIREAKKEIKKDSKAFVWHIWVRVTAPNGQFRDADGHCSSSERMFTRLEHDVYATAVTRAKNRGILELAGFGEVSAEEITDDNGQTVKTVNPLKITIREPDAPITTSQRKKLMVLLKQFGFTGKKGLERWKKMSGKQSISKLTKGEASFYIDGYEMKLKEQKK